MVRKKLICIMAAFAAILSMGCGASPSGPSGIASEPSVNDGTVELRVWAEENNLEMLNKMIESFKQKYSSEAKFDITIEVQSDSELRDKLLGDVNNGPDVFHFPDDQLNSLIAGGVLSPVDNTDAVKSANTQSSVDAASYNGKMYAYPMTADNGYFLYYDKNYVTDDDAKTFDGLLAAAQNAGKKVSMEINSGWYMYSFFGGAGLKLTLNDDGVTNSCNWNTTDGTYTGLDVAQAMVNIISNPAFMNAPDGDFVNNAKNGTVVAAVSGVWNAIGVKEAWGDNYGAVKLPTYTCNGNQVQMSSFTGYKMIGVNSYSDNIKWAHKFADWITNEQNQTIRFTERNQGPSNIKAASSDQVTKVPAIQAVIAQSQYGVLQRVANNYWTPCTKFANALLAGTSSPDELQAELDTMVEGITSSVAK